MTTESDNSNSLWRPVFLGYLLCAVVTAVLLSVLLAFTVTQTIDIKFITDSACRQVEHTPWYSSFTYCFYGKDWDESTYLSAISGFYSTTIAVLVAVQALVSGLAFVYVRSTNRRAIEDEVEVQLPAYFQNIKSVEMVENAVEKISSQAVERAVAQQTVELTDKFSELEQNFYGLQSDYETLREVVKELIGETDDDVSDTGGVISE